MQKELLPKVEQFAKQNKRRSIWRKFVRAMACVVVFCTTYALILPAITLEREKCTLEEHTHSDSCYRKVTSREQRSLLCSYEILGIHTHTEQCLDAEQNLICGVADFVLHEHDASCFNENDTLICLLPEIKEHQHSEGCYQMPQVEEHSHTDACYSVQRGALLCQMEEYEGHAHTAECMIRGDLICQLEESEGHVHGDSCVQEESPCELPETEGHIHGDDCYALVPDCGQEETQGHFHEDACYEQISELICQPVETEPAEPIRICDKEKIELHTHDEKNCYETYLDENEEEQTRLICQRTVVEEHVHGECCFVTESVPMEDVDTLTCTLEEGEDHTHTERCYGTWELICGKEEHAHTEECMLVDEEEPVGNGEDSSEPVGYADDGETMQMLYAARQDSDHFVTYHKDITSLLSSVEIYNSNNELVYETKYGTGLKEVTVGENCRIVFVFEENEYNQFSPGNNDILTYQMPSNLSAAVVGSGIIRNRNNTIVANYQIENDQLRITPVLVNGKNFFGDFNNVSLTIEFDAEVMHTQDSTSTNIDFHGNFNVTVNMNQDTKIDAQKHELEYDPETQTIKYQSTVTAYGGTVPITYVSDWWWPDKASIDTTSIQLLDKNKQPYDMSRWTFQPNDSGFILTPMDEVILNHKESITLTYDVKVDNNLTENFDLSNSFFAISQDDGKELKDTDTVVTPIIVTNIDKTGIQTTETVDGVDVDVLKWTVVIDNSKMDVLTMTDTLGQAQTFCEHQPITIKAMKTDGTYEQITVQWNAVQKKGNTEFSYALPTQTVDGKTVGYKSYELTYYSHFDTGTDNTGLKVFDNTVTTTTPNNEKTTVGHGSVGVVGVPPGIVKTAEADQEWITFTINCTMPAGLYNQSNVLIYDSLSIWDDNKVGYFFQQNPDSMRVTVTPEEGEPYQLTPYTNQQSAENTYLLVNADQDFTMYFNTAQPTPGTSVWKCQGNSTLTITYRVSRNAPWLDDWGGNPTDKTLNDYLEESPLGIQNTAQLDYAPGQKVTHSVHIAPPEKPNPPLQKTATVATDQDGKERDGVYNYSVLLDTSTGIFNEQATSWEYDINSLLFSDTYDSRMQYVSNSFRVKAWSIWDVCVEFKFKDGKGPSISENNTTITVSADDLVAVTNDYLNGQTLRQVLQGFTGGRVEFTYQLEVKQDAKVNATEGILYLDNVASIDWTDRFGSHETPDATHQVAYQTGVLGKEMAVVKDNGGNPTNFVEFEIVVNEYAKDLIEGEDTYILHDYMSSNLEPRNTLTVEAQINGETRELSLLECQFAYDSAEHKMTFVLPDEAKITIKYECLVNGVGGTTEQINNRVSLQGKSFIQDIVDSAFQIQDHQGSATSGNEQFFLKKIDSRTGKGLEGVTFKLYGDTRPSENEGAADLHLTHEDHVHDMFLYGTFTTGPNGTVHIHDTQLTSGHLYALEEVAPLEGYIGASDLYWFYMIEPKPNSLRELDIIYSFDTVTIENDPVGGYELPSTGGAGTTMFYIFGGILVLAAVVLLVTKKRMAVAE